jgi:hypothetical protein
VHIVVVRQDANTAGRQLSPLVCVDPQVRHTANYEDTDVAVYIVVRQDTYTAGKQQTSCVRVYVCVCVCVRARARVDPLLQLRRTAVLAAKYKDTHFAIQIVVRQDIYCGQAPASSCLRGFLK